MNALIHMAPFLACILTLFSIVPQTESVTLDLSLTAFPDVIECYHGTFLNCGVYRFFRTRSGIISMIKYGSTLLDGPVYDLIYGLKEVIVQDYKRDGIHMVTVHLCFENNTPLQTQYLKVVNGTFITSTKDILHSLINGPILLSLNLREGSVHPFITMHQSSGFYNGFQWSLLPSTHHKAYELPELHIRVNMGLFFISPIFIVDKEHTFPNPPPTCLSAPITKFFVSSKDNSMVLWLKRNRRSKPLAIRLPSTIDGVFRPKNILLIPQNISYLEIGYKPSRDNEITIDISKTESTISSLIILSNLLRGDWYYSQYTIVPIEAHEYNMVNVINSIKRCDIYKSTESESVSHIELFDNYINGWQYVVVNMSVIDGTNITEKKKVYMRHFDERGDKYMDLDVLGIHTYLDILYNIQTIDPELYSRPGYTTSSYGPSI
ncbi:hypothetical protein BBOV_III008960 [Babesia bovis T2Bo]|uniref:Uncharacterized protein n=1 Tax=Babesia bovis TaxID=5865 RepID=A7APG9_BABBO|nr:hypothetical protein BBOV_III008960 [Babesia bovis T2Bo]EDO08453.1 hypothetical protein BBOV_III008960 [Babesia bovis T2Bo]|eukprot:XP_001612021.1 hypothetical protein [Babesia bovis T2Bo]